MTTFELFSLIPTARLFLMMLAMGMTLDVADFRRVVARPLGFALGATGQLVVLPAAAFTIAWLGALRPELAIGLLLIAACPGGVTSNAVTHWARGDVALSILLTAFSSLVAFVTLPIVVNLGLMGFGEASADIVLPVGETMAKLFLSTALPVLLGMWIRSHRLALAERWHGPLLYGSAGLLVLLVLALGFRLMAEDLGELFVVAAPAVGLLITLMMIFGWTSGRLLRLPRAQSRTVAIEIGLQNFNLAMVIALSILEREEFLGPALIYLPTMFTAVAVLVFLTRD
jgi:BASS family bile acid:Na+ symporter